MPFCDSHFHISLCDSSFTYLSDTQYMGVSCALTKEEWDRQSLLAAESEGRILQCFGIHPWYPDTCNVEFLEELSQKRLICAIGECGFDFYSEELKKNAVAQRCAWEICLDAAVKYNLPIVIHNRKALDILFSYKAKLKKCQSVIFHAFPWTEREAQMFLKTGINAYFSFGNNLVKGSKRSVECIKKLPINRILLETDAPYQNVDIASVYNSAKTIRHESDFDLLLQRNFFEAFCLGV